MQKDTVEVIINSDGKSCTTLNRLGEKLHPRDFDIFGLFDAADRWSEYENQWQQAESERKTYEIAPSGCKDCQSNGVAHCAYPTECLAHWPYKPGTKHESKITKQ